MTVDPIPIDSNFRLEVGFAIASTLGPGEEESLPYSSLVGGVPSSSPQSWVRNFFPYVTSVERQLTIRFQTLEGKRYKQIVTVRPFKESVRPVELSAVKPDFDELKY